MAKKNRKTSIFGTPRRVEQPPSYSSEASEYAKNFEPNPRLKRIIQLIILVVAVVFAVQAYYSRKAIRAEATAELQKEQQAKESEMGSEVYHAYIKLKEEAELAFENKEYFEAAYKYRQAADYDPGNKGLQLKMLNALDKSCVAGNTLHCKVGKKVRDKLEGQK